MAISRRTERAMVRSMCGVKLVDKKNNEELMEMLALEETLDKIAKVNRVLWYEHVVSATLCVMRNCLNPLLLLSY